MCIGIPKIIYILQTINKTVIKNLAVPFIIYNILNIKFKLTTILVLIILVQYL